MRTIADPSFKHMLSRALAAMILVAVAAPQLSSASALGRARLVGEIFPGLGSAALQEKDQCINQVLQCDAAHSSLWKRCPRGASLSARSRAGETTDSPKNKETKK